MQQNKDLDNQKMRMYFTTNQFPNSKFLGPHNKPHGACVLGKNYHTCFDLKIGYVTYKLCCIPCDCILWTYIIDHPCIAGFPAQQQPRYKPVKEYTYWPVLGSFNNCNILKLSHEATSNKEIGKIHQVVLEGISENMLHWYKLMNIFPLIQHIQSQWSTM